MNTSVIIIAIVVVLGVPLHHKLDHKTQLKYTATGRSCYTTRGGDGEQTEPSSLDGADIFSTLGPS